MMSIKLDDNQIDAVNRLKNGSILCADVGSGKSITALAYYYKWCGGDFSTDNFSEMLNPQDLYIITTAQKRDKHEWDGELAHFLLSREDCDVNVVVDSWNNITKYKDVTAGFFIFDEQRVVGYGVWVKSFLKIAKNNNWILLTATPGDKWSDYIPVFIANGFFKNKTEFMVNHAVIDYRNNYRRIDHYVNQGKLVKYRNEILVVMKSNKHTISHKETILVDYDKLQYKTVVSKRWDIFNEEPIENVSKLFYIARKVINSDQTRIDTVLDLVNKHKKVIIFYNFDYELEILRNLEYEKGTVVAEWTGHNHQLVPKGSRWVYLVQYSAGAEGWNCTDTNVIIFYSQSYSYKATVQAAGRIDRRNTPYTDLYYYYIRSAAPIDIGIARALKQKKNFNESSFSFK